MKLTIGSIRDLIDLEYFLQRDENEPGESARAALADRDREIYLRKIRPVETRRGKMPAGQLFRLWLDERRKLEKGSVAGPKAPLPGDVYAEMYRLMGYVFSIAGVLSGGGLAFSLLNYRGTQPLNVSVYLAALVLSQSLALLFLIGIRLLRRLRRSPFHGSVLFTLVAGVMARLFVRMKEGALKGLHGSQRGSIEAVAGLIRGRRQVYGTVFSWPVFVLFQMFGIGFNVGALSATLLKVLGSDVAFGWQSTVQFSSRLLYQIVQGIALPWSWCVPTHLAHPSLSEIEGSRLVLKEGIYHLATQDLVSWWPFLFLAVLTYGLAPRVVLLVMGVVFQKKALSRVDLGHAAGARLLHRLTAPLVRTQSRSAQPLVSAVDRVDPLSSVQKVAPDREDAAGREPIVALIPDDIFEACEGKDLEDIVAEVLGCPVRETMRFGRDPRQDEEVLHRVAAMTKTDHAPAVLLVQEAWQPPIREGLRFIQELRKVMGTQTMLWIGLIGKPRQGKIFTRTTPEDAQVWQQKLEALGDPYLGVERLAGHEP